MATAEQQAIDHIFSRELLPRVHEERGRSLLNRLPGLSSRGAGDLENRETQSYTRENWLQGGGAEGSPQRDGLRQPDAHHRVRDVDTEPLERATEALEFGSESLGIVGLEVRLQYLRGVDLVEVRERTVQPN